MFKGDKDVVFTGRLFRLFNEAGKSVTPALEETLKKELRCTGNPHVTSIRATKQLNELLRLYLGATRKESDWRFRGQRSLLLPEERVPTWLLEKISLLDSNSLVAVKAKKYRADKNFGTYLDRLEASIHQVEADVWKNRYAREESRFNDFVENDIPSARKYAKRVINDVARWHDSAKAAALLFRSLGTGHYLHLFTDSLLAKKERFRFCFKNPSLFREEQEQAATGWYDALNDSFVDGVMAPLGKNSLFIMSDRLRAATVLADYFGDRAYLPKAQRHLEELRKILKERPEMERTSRYVARARGLERLCEREPRYFAAD
ncbi:hypothetical protein JXA12_05590 [Candidatus Woesearchaeota archaeon]|nr:hypothetical protein [Candidatus Woesearchaeota archaeon]